MTAIIPQAFIDGTQIQLDTLMQSIKDAGTQDVTVEEIALQLYDKRGMITDIEHRQVLVVMVAILIKRACER